MHEELTACVKRFLARVKRALRYELHAWWRRRPISKGTVLYESFSGNGMLCNPEAIFRALLAAADQAHLKHVWALSDLRRYRSTVAEFSGVPNVRFVRYRSSAYFRALATSEFLVNNATFPPDFGKRPGQVYLNTWHGTPLKRMGYDIQDGALHTANTIRNFVAADYLLAANRFMTDQMYASAYKLKGVYHGKIIEEGYPRIDRQVLTGEQADAVRARLTGGGIPLGNRKIILYAPTWKGASFGRPDDDVAELVDWVAELESKIDTSEYCVLLKTHQRVHEMAARRPELVRLLVPNEIPTNVILGVTDILVTDYSSIYFDFLATGRPVLFFTPDLDDYVGARGLYFEPDELPGPACRTVDDLAARVRECAATDALPAEFAERYQGARRDFCGFDDGAAAERVIDIVFRGRTNGYRIRDGLADGRPSILMYLGGMHRNGITASALNLLAGIDHTRFDVSAFFAQSRRSDVIANQMDIDGAVRQFPRVGGMNGSKLSHLQRTLAYRRGRISGHRSNRAQNSLWDDEWVRCFGDSRFDYVVDFSGYGPFWSALLLHSPGGIRSIWLHNDLATDAHREVAGTKRMLRSLTAVFSLYPQYDRLVSVSSALADINRSKLARYASGEKFVFALNMIDASSVLREAQVGLRESTRDTETESNPVWVERMLTGGVSTFVSVARLSPEKNHARLIRAFEQVHALNRVTQLLIVGSGPLDDDLETLIGSLGLADAVFLTGQQANPYAIMAAADCFVLSSDYEGQPMVILEALVLGLPVVTVDFGSSASALPDDSGLIVPQTVEGLVDGMTAFLRGEVRSGSFDYDAYNATVVTQFSAAVGVASHDDGGRGDGLVRRGRAPLPARADNHQDRNRGNTGERDPRQEHAEHHDEGSEDSDEAVPAGDEAGEEGVRGLGRGIRR